MQSRSHYDQFPYDVGVRAHDYLSAPGLLGDFLRSIRCRVAVDVGCGPGNLLAALSQGADLVVGVDLSARSLRLALDRSQRRATVVHSDALRLPLATDSADTIVATGSLHHTGRASAAFAELARVLRPGGSAFVAVYAAKSYYQYVYRSVGALARRCQRHTATDLLVNRCFILPAFSVYFVAGRAITQHRLAVPSIRHLQNYFADQLLNPVVSFHSGEELRRWASDRGLSVVSMSRSHAGALVQMVVAKPVKAERAVPTDSTVGGR